MNQRDVHARLRVDEREIASRRAFFEVTDEDLARARVAAAARREAHGGARYLRTPFVLGAPIPSPKEPRTENAALDREDTVIVFTDGLSTRTSLGDEAHDARVLVAR